MIGKWSCDGSRRPGGAKLPQIALISRKAIIFAKCENTHPRFRLSAFDLIKDFGEVDELNPAGKPLVAHEKSIVPPLNRTRNGGADLSLHSDNIIPWPGGSGLRLEFVEKELRASQRYER